MRRWGSPGASPVCAKGLWKTGGQAVRWPIQDPTRAPSPAPHREQAASPDEASLLGSQAALSLTCLLLTAPADRTTLNATPGRLRVAVVAVADDERLRMRCVLLLHLQCSGLYDARVVQQLVEGSELHLERVRVWGCVWVRFSEDRAHGRDSVCVCVGQGGHPEPAPCTPHTSPYIILPEPYSPHNSPYIIPPEPYTPHNSPYIIPPEPHTPHTSPYIVPPEPYTTHTSPYIIPPELYTPHTSPYIIPTEPYLMPTPCRSSCTTVWVSTRLLCVCSPWSWLMWRRL